MHVELGHELPVSKVQKRHELFQGLWGDHHPSGVGGRVTQKPLQLQGDLEELCHLGVLIDHRLKLWHVL